MIVRIAILSLVAVASLSVPEVAQAATNMSRTQIRSMPITARPSRPGHFYGNAVRRRSGPSVGMSR